MTTSKMPDMRPANPSFSSGPCVKRPGWTSEALAHSLVGRSHRSSEGKERLKDLIDKSHALLGLPEDYKIGIVPGSDTGAVEMALWSMLGARGVDMLAWESFGAGWVGDVTMHLKLDDVRVLDADYGQLPDLDAVDFTRDVVFTWNGTTSGVRVPNGDWIADDREGLTICDATSAAFAMDIPWDKIDVATYSWQKVMGGEGAHGMLILSPRAVERLESYTPPWPLPKVFRLTKGGKLIDGVFRGETLNTPSMIAVEDALDGLNWAETVGGAAGLRARCEENFGTLDTWVEQTPWIANLADDPAIRSCTSVCLKVVDGDLDAEQQAAVAKRIVVLLKVENAALDLGAYRDAPPGLRIWTGATVEKTDVEALLPWLEWAFQTAKSEIQA